MLQHLLVVAVVHADVVLGDLHAVDQGVADRRVQVEVLDRHVQVDAGLDVEDDAQLGA